jgi:hypothetical protein
MMQNFLPILISGVNNNHLKSILLFIFILISHFATATHYKLNDLAIDQLFNNATVTAINSNYKLLTTKLSNDVSYEKYKAGSLAILCGAAGLHRFYLNHYLAGGVLAGVSLIGLGLIVTTMVLTSSGVVSIPFLTCIGFLPLLTTTTVGIIDGISYILSNNFESQYKKNPKIIQWLKTSDYKEL